MTTQVAYLLDILVIILVVYNLRLSLTVNPNRSVKYDVLAGILGAGIFAAARFNPILGFIVFIVIVVILPFIPERAADLMFSNSDDEDGWYLTGGLYIGMAIGFYAFILSFINILSIGFAGLNLFNSIRGKIRKESPISTPTKREEPFSRFHPETMAPLLVDVFALFWSSFNLNLLIRDAVQWDVSSIWRISSNILLFLAVLFHIHFLTQNSGSSIELIKEEVEVRGSLVSLLPLLALFLIEFVVPDTYWDSYSLQFIMCLGILCVLWIATTMAKTSIKWRTYSAFSSIFFFCSMTWYTLQPEFASFSTGYLLILIAVAAVIGLQLMSGYLPYPFNLMAIISLNLPHITFLFDSTFSIVFLAVIGAYIVFCEGPWLIFQLKHMLTQARCNVLMVLAMKPYSRIDRRRKSEIEALEELVQEGIVECVSDQSHQERNAYKIRSKKWESKLLDMATDKEWLDEISERDH